MNTPRKPMAGITTDPELHGHQAAVLAGHDRDSLVLLLLATDLARAGQYEEADALIESALGEGASRPHALDLRARMLAQRQRYAEAEACWIEAVRLDPGNTTYHKALDTILRERSPRVRWVGVGLAVLILLGGMAAALVTHDLYISLAHRLAQAEASQSAYRQQLSESQRLDADLKAAKAESAATASSFAEFRRGHSHSDDEYALLGESKSRLDDQLASARKDLAAERASNVDLTRQYASFNDHVNQLTQQQAALVAALGLSRQEVRRETKAARASQHELLESTIIILRSLRPMNADELVSRLKELTARRDQLRDLVAQYERWNFVPFRLLDTRLKLADSEKELNLCQAEYDARVVPWEAGMAKLQAAVIEFNDSAAPPASSQPALGRSTTGPMENP